MTDGSRMGGAIIPRATYRLQLHKDFGFAAAADAAPYIAALGVSHLYLSPIFMARAGSTHGYDILDHGRLNSELGGEEGFAALAARCRELDLRIILDFVPNHMGVGGDDNPLWKDVLEWGEASPHADWFDIEWRPDEPSLRGRVLLPFLGRPYGDVLADGELDLAFDAATGELSFAYFDNRFPLAPHSYAQVLAATGDAALQTLAGAFDGLAEITAADEARTAASALKRALADAAGAGRAAALEAACARIAAPGDDRRAAELHALLEAQHYRLAFWRVAADEINYRRFFDINGLAGLCMNKRAVFEYAHHCLLELIARGDAHGVRLDHIDGLYDPQAYCRDLQTAAGAALGSPAGESRPLYLIVEKILAQHESMPADWPVHGATGYEFMALVNGVFVDPAGEAPLTRLYRRFTGHAEPLPAVLEHARRQIVRNNLASEVSMLARRMHRLAKAGWRTQDFSFHAIRDALTDVLALFPVYRTYVGEDGPSEQDRRYIDWAVAQAKKSPGLLDDTVYEFVRSILTGALTPAAGDTFSGGDVTEARRRFEQLTPPVMAKAMEDTTFYRYVRLVSVNEVGGDPARFSVAPGGFHAACRSRQDCAPGSLNATATHDHKRGEDTRARINVLSEIPLDWTKTVMRWARMNRNLGARGADSEAPARNDEYLFYQMLAGAWPLDLAPDDADGVGAYAGRLAAYMQKAAREAKLHTSWAAPNQDYETALGDFVRRALDPERRSAFLRSVHEFVQRIAPAGAINSLAQTVLKLTAPGAPDIYQGCELWDFSLVDPDNRRPVDYGARADALDAGSPESLARDWRDGRIKLALVRRLLRLRAEHPALFAAGGYKPLEVEGDGAARVLGFERAYDGKRVVALVPRLAAAFARGDGPLSLDPAGWADTRLRDHDLQDGDFVVGGPGRSLCELYGAFPVAIWIKS